MLRKYNTKTNPPCSLSRYTGDQTFSYYNFIYTNYSNAILHLADFCSCRHFFFRHHQRKISICIFCTENHSFTEDSGKFGWKASGKYAPIAEANPSYHGVSFVDAAGPAAFVTYVRAILLRDTGAAISPFNAFLLLQGVETLSLRLERHAENTKKVVEYLSKHPQVSKVNHPSLPEHPDHELYEKYFPNGGASIFTFEIKGGQEAAWKFIDNLKIFSLLANVADVKSLVIHPATTTHSQLSEAELADQGITPSTIRLSIGTEHIDDIIADLENGFAAIQ